MNTVTLHDATLTVEPRGLDKLWSLTRRIDVPIRHVRGATYDPGANHEPKGVRRPGLHVPGKTAGTFVHDHETIFWNVRHPRDTIIIELADERYARLVVSVDHPRELVAEINDALPA